MDPVSHVAFGRTLIGTIVPTERLDGRLRGCIGSTVLGSLSPDLDAVLMPFGWDRYLRMHEVGTHTIAGALVCALATAAVVHRLARPTRFSLVMLSAWLGATSHVLLDLLSGARLRPGWPFIDTVVSVPLVAMADPWLFALCAAGVAGPVVLTRSGPRRARVAVLGLMAVFLGAKAAMGILAFSNYRKATRQSEQIVLARVVEARWASLNTWYVFDRTPRHVRSWRAGPNGADEVLRWPLGPESPSVTQSRSLSTVANFLRAHALGFAVTLPRDAGSTLVLWSDIRFCWDPNVPGARRLEPIVRSAVGDQQIACALWFGGELHANGRPRLEVVKVGGFTQTRVPIP